MLPEDLPLKQLYLIKIIRFTVWRSTVVYLATYQTRAVGSSENPRVPVLFGGHNLKIQSWMFFDLNSIKEGTTKYFENSQINADFIQILIVGMNPR